MGPAEWIALGTGVLGVAAWMTHQTYQLGQIKGSLDRDLVYLRDREADHEERLRALERVKPNFRGA